MQKIIFIDRDGVINVDLIGDYIKTWSEFRFEEGALEALKMLTDNGFDIILISNQAGIGDGVYPEESLWEIHDKMLKEMTKKDIRIFSSYYCPHGKNEGCKCRKPEIGLLEGAVKDIQYDPQKTFLIGDKLTDIQAGKRFGLKTVLVRTGHGADAEGHITDNDRPEFVSDNLLDATKKIVSL